MGRFVFSCTTMSYSNRSNPFNDDQLNQKFVWKKKRGADQEDDFSRKIQVASELEKLKRRREQREKEQQWREQEKIRLQRDLEDAALGDWRQKEDEFLLGQSKKRALIRLREGRPTPSDFLILDVSLPFDEDLAADFDAHGLDLDMNEPHQVLEKTNDEELAQLQKDIQLFLDLEKDPKQHSYWQALFILAENEKNQRLPGYLPAVGVSPDVYQEIQQTLKSKTHDQLALLQRQVQQKLKSGGPVDVDYWEALLKSLILWQARAKLREMHTTFLEMRIRDLKKVQKIERRAETKEPEKVLDRTPTDDGYTDFERKFVDNLKKDAYVEDASGTFEEGEEDFADETILQKVSFPSRLMGLANISMARQTSS
jgi:hypothetical protein